MSNRKAWNNRQVQVTCVCGVAFLKSPSVTKRFCSKSCFYGTRKAVCLICEKSFSIGRWKSENGKGKFCSLECRFESQKRALELNCGFCGSLFEKKKSQEARSKNHFCSKSCSISFHVGCNHPQFICGKGYGAEWRRISESIRNRDVNCRRCGKTEFQNRRKLDVHHINPFFNFGYERRMEAHSDSNLIALCRSCHKTVEEGSSCC